MRLIKKFMELFDTKVEEPELIFPKPPLNISEPVYSFVECVRNNPKRFKIVFENEMEVYNATNTGGRKYHLIDKVTKEIFSFSCHKNYYGLGAVVHYKYPHYITNDEFEYMREQLVPIFEAKQTLKDQLQASRRDRKVTKIRERLIDIYCTGENYDN